MFNRINNKMHKKNKVISQINVTPFVDVMLVLLIVFMITAPMLTVGVQVDLPKTKANQLNSDADPLIITMKKNRDIYIQDAIVEYEDVISRLKAISKVNFKTRIFVRGDNLLPYGEVISLMGLIQSAGYEKVALVAKLPDDS